mgnify:CR=1 FL=1
MPLKQDKEIEINWNKEEIKKSRERGDLRVEMIGVGKVGTLDDDASDEFFDSISESAWCGYGFTKEF